MSRIDFVLAACALVMLGAAGFLGFAAYRARATEPTASARQTAQESSDPLSNGPSPVVLGQRAAQQKTGADGAAPKPAGTGSPQTKIRLKKTAKADPAFLAELQKKPGAKRFSLTDVIGSNTAAEAVVLRENGRLHVAVKAFVPVPSEDSFYQAWLMKEQPRKQYVPLGVLEVQKDFTFLVTKTITPSYKDFESILITLEQSDDRYPERAVLQGKAP